jgi:hypothetical protein
VNGQDVPICKQYFDFKFNLNLITNGITIFVTIVNTILSTITIKLITWIGYDTQSLMMQKITNGIFIA